METFERDGKKMVVIDGKTYSLTEEGPPPLTPEKKAELERRAQEELGWAEDAVGQVPTTGERGLWEFVERYGTPETGNAVEELLKVCRRFNSEAKRPIRTIAGAFGWPTDGFIEG